MYRNYIKRVQKRAQKSYIKNTENAHIESIKKYKKDTEKGTRRTHKLRKKGAERTQIGRRKEAEKA